MGRQALALALASGCLASSTLAGNVQVTLEGSLLKVRGDNTANSISMAQTAVGDVFVSGATGTTVNGRPSIVLRRVQLNAVDILMEGGNDSVTMRGLVIANDLFMNMGSGNDRVGTSGPITVGANMAIEGGSGTDTIRLTDATVGQDLYIDGGLGALNADITGLDGGKGLTVIGDEANDIVNVVEAIVGDYISIETKGGFDRVTVRDSIAFGLAVNTDLGADVVTVLGLATEESIGIFTGGGNDTVTLTDVNTNNSLTVSVDVGDDRVVGTGVSAGQDAVFEGGAGTDSLNDLGITGGTKKDIKEFEVVTP
ncbi:MAG: hypothetical protein IT423_17320 [Pirellulaceae bacterium]|nr:hypothetical protein [Pirellulaceae bacterium]